MLGPHGRCERIYEFAAQRARVNVYGVLSTILRRGAAPSGPHAWRKQLLGMATIDAQVCKNTVFCQSQKLASSESPSNGKQRRVWTSTCLLHAMDEKGMRDNGWWMLSSQNNSKIASGLKGTTQVETGRNCQPNKGQHMDRDGGGSRGVLGRTSGRLLGWRGHLCLRVWCFRLVLQALFFLGDPWSLLFAKKGRCAEHGVTYSA